jgi:hypothetical protein
MYGAKWLWILAGGSSASQAASYYEDIGITFGWFTHDGDNSYASNIFAGTPMASGVPWVGVIDADTMQVAYNNPYNVYGIVQSLGSD